MPAEHLSLGAKRIPWDHRKEVLVGERRDPRSGESPPDGFADSVEERGESARR